MAAMAPPAESPATYTRRVSTPCSAITFCVRLAITAGSPAPRRWWLCLNQFQQRDGLACCDCAGYSTRKPCSRANAFMPVPAAKSSGFCVQPCSMTTSGSDFPAALGGTYSL
jgi:hypothetical protein